MSSGDEIEAGRTTTAQKTTQLHGQRPEDLGNDFNGEFVLEVGTSTDIFEPQIRVSGILGAARLGGVGLTGIGGASGGTGVQAVGAFGDGSTVPGAGLEAVGGAAIPTNNLPTAGDRSPHGPGIIASPFGSVQSIARSDTGNVGVFGQGGDMVEDTRDLAGVPFVIGPGFAGAEIIGQGGANRGNNNVANAPVVALKGGGAGVVGVAGRVKMPDPDQYANIGVFGVADSSAGVAGLSTGGSGIAGSSTKSSGVAGISVEGPGVSGFSAKDRGAVFQSTALAQLGLSPVLKNPAALTVQPLVAGRPGDVLVTLVKTVEAMGNVDVAELWFCNLVTANGTVNWIKLA